ncbi:glycosyltransferase family 2 protein [Terrimonas alba]|uniref:glycosyltransferase family 2 protein n=1 Tax=Terrimonas alba TaxID=3349636 RepID=UPI0035F24130
MSAITPKISIITCFLNTELYIRETIESVLKQDYDNWELVLIDDGSFDNSTSIARAFAAEYPGKIIYLEHEDHATRGASKSRNLGIKKASGTLIAFLDADDLWFPDMLSSLLNIMQQHPATMICEASEYWYDWNDSGRKNEIVTIGAEQDKLYLPPQLALTLYPLNKGAAPCICGMLVQKEIINKHGAFDESFTGMYDDQSFLIKFYLHEPVYISSSCKNRYRQRPGSLVHSSHEKGEYIRDRKYFLVWLKYYLKNNKIHYPEVNFLLQKALLPFSPTWFVRHVLLSRVKRMLRKALSINK